MEELRIRVTAEELAIIQRAARHAGMTDADWCRRRILLGGGPCRGADGRKKEKQPA